MKKALVFTFAVALSVLGVAQLRPERFPRLPDSRLLAGYPGYALAVTSSHQIYLIFNDGTDSVSTYGASLSRDGLTVATGIPSRTDKNSRYPAFVATYSIAEHKWKKWTPAIEELRATAISPDATRLAYAVAPRKSASPVQLHVIDLHTGAEIVSKEIGYTVLWNIGWSPDGTCLTYDTYEKPSRIESETPGVFLLDLRTSTAKRIADGFEPAWSPSGEWIAYLDGWNRVAIVNRGGSNHRVVLSAKNRFAFAPVWSSDSMKLIANELVNQDKFTFDLHMIDLRNNSDEMIRRGTTAVFGWVAGEARDR